jgi:hypothetical protein
MQEQKSNLDQQLRDLEQSLKQAEDSLAAQKSLSDKLLGEKLKLESQVEYMTANL